MYLFVYLNYLDLCVSIIDTRGSLVCSRDGNIHKDVIFDHKMSLKQNFDMFINTEMLLA